jgi:hypothetical protein
MDQRAAPGGTLSASAEEERRLSAALRGGAEARRRPAEFSERGGLLEEVAESVEGNPRAGGPGLLRRRPRRGRVRGVRLLAALALAVQVAAAPTGVAAQAPCRFVLGFAELRHQVGAHIVGECIENQQVADFGAQQGTTTGSLVWLRDRNITYFIHFGQSRVWILGPEGLQTRAVDEYFPWEVAGGRSPLTSVRGRPSVPVGSARQAAPASSPPARPGMTRNQLNAACFSDYVTTLGFDLSGPDRSAEAEAVYLLCGEAIEKDGELGLHCYREAYRAARALARALPSSTRAATAYDDAYRSCTAR